MDRTGTLFAAGAADGAIKIFDIRGGYATHTFHGHSGVVSALHFFEAIDERSSAKGPNTKKRKKPQWNGVAVVANNPKEEATIGFRLASGGEDGKIRIWDLHRRKSVAILDSHVSVVRGLDFSETENALVSGSRDKTIMLWDTKIWKIRSTIPVSEAVETVGFAKEGAYIYAGGENGRIRMWSTKFGREITGEQEACGDNEGIVDILRPENPSFLLSVHADQSFRLHSLSPLDGTIIQDTVPSLPIIRRVSGTHDEVIDLAYIGVERSCLALATNLEELRIISLTSRPTSPLTNGNNDSPLNTTFAPYFGADVTSLRGHTDIIITLDADWSGHWLVTGAKDNTARLWRLDPAHNSYVCYATFHGHAESIAAVTMPHHAPPSESAAYTNPLDHPPAFVLTGSQDKTVKRWDVPRGISAEISDEPVKVARAAYTRKAHDKDINALDTNSNSTLFASASQDRTVKIWDIEAGETIGILRGHKRGVWSAKFSPPGIKAISGESGATSSASRGYVVTGSGDKTVRIWSLVDYSCLRTFEGHTNSVLKVLWLPAPSSKGGAEGHRRGKRGPQVVSAAGDGLVKVWDVQEGDIATTLDNHTDRVWALAVDPGTGSPARSKLEGDEEEDVDMDDTELDAGDPLVILSGGADGVLTFWHDTTTASMTAAITRSNARIEADQSLQNLIRTRSYREAIVLALQLDHPARLLQLFRDAAAQHPSEPGALTGVHGVDEVIKSLGDEQLWLLLFRTREWNTSAKNAAVAHRVLNAVAKLIPKDRLVKLKPPRGFGGRKGPAGKKQGVKDVSNALKAYSERHQNRKDRTKEAGFMVMYTLQQIDDGMGIDGVDSLAGPFGIHNGRSLANGVGADLEMAG